MPVLLPFAASFSSMVTSDRNEGRNEGQMQSSEGIQSSSSYSSFTGSEFGGAGTSDDVSKGAGGGTGGGTSGGGGEGGTSEERRRRRSRMALDGHVNVLPAEGGIIIPIGPLASDWASDSPSAAALGPKSRDFVFPGEVVRIVVHVGPREVYMSEEEGIVEEGAGADQSGTEVTALRSGSGLLDVFPQTPTKQGRQQQQDTCLKSDKTEARASMLVEVGSSSSANEVGSVVDEEATSPDPRITLASRLRQTLGRGEMLDRVVNSLLSANQDDLPVLLGQMTMRMEGEKRRSKVLLESLGRSHFYVKFSGQDTSSTLTSLRSAGGRMSMNTTQNRGLVHHRRRSSTGSMLGVSGAHNSAVAASLRSGPGADARGGSDITMLSSTSPVESEYGCSPVLVEQGEFDPRSAGGLARTILESCCLPNGDVAVVLQLSIATDNLTREANLEVLQFERLEPPLSSPLITSPRSRRQSGVGGGGGRGGGEFAPMGSEPRGGSRGPAAAGSGPGGGGGGGGGGKPLYVSPAAKSSLFNSRSTSAPADPCKNLLHWLLPLDQQVSSSVPTLLPAPASFSAGGWSSPPRISTSTGFSFSSMRMPASPTRPTTPTLQQSFSFHSGMGAGTAAAAAVSFSDDMNAGGDGTGFAGLAASGAGDAVGSEGILSFRGMALEPQRFVAQCGLEGPHVPGKCWSKPISILHPLKIESHAADCNTEEFICILVENVLPPTGATASVEIYIDSISLECRSATADQNMAPLPVHLSCVDAGMNHTLPGLALKPGEQHSFVMRPSMPVNDAIATAWTPEAPGDGMELRRPTVAAGGGGRALASVAGGGGGSAAGHQRRESKDLAGLAADNLRLQVAAQGMDQGGPPSQAGGPWPGQCPPAAAQAQSQAKFSIIVSCRCSHTESRLQFRHPLSWQPRPPRDMLLSVTMEEQTPLPVATGPSPLFSPQVVHVRATNLTSLELSLTLIAPSYLNLSLLSDRFPLSSVSPRSISSELLQRPSMVRQSGQRGEEDHLPTSKNSSMDFERDIPGGIAGLRMSPAVELVQSSQQQSSASSQGKETKQRPLRPARSLPPIQRMESLLDSFPVVVKSQTAGGGGGVGGNSSGSTLDVEPSRTHLWLQSVVPLGRLPAKSTTAIRCDLLPLTDGIISLDTLHLASTKRDMLFVPENPLQIFIPSKSCASTTPIDLCSMEDLSLS